MISAADMNSFEGTCGDPVSLDVVITENKRLTDHKAPPVCDEFTEMMDELAGQRLSEDVRTWPVLGAVKFWWHVFAH